MCITSKSYVALWLLFFGPVWHWQKIQKMEKNEAKIVNHLDSPCRLPPFNESYSCSQSGLFTQLLPSRIKILLSLLDPLGLGVVIVLEYCITSCDFIILCTLPYK